MNETEKFITFILQGEKRLPPAIRDNDSPFLVVPPPEKLCLRVYAEDSGKVYVQATHEGKMAIICQESLLRNPEGSLERALIKVGIGRECYIEDDLTRILEKITHARFAIQDYFADRKVCNDYYQAHERELGKLTAKRGKQ